MFQRRVVDSIETHFMFNAGFFKSCAVCEIMWKNIVELGRTQMTIWRMRIARWVTNASETPTICNTYCFSTATIVARTRRMLLYTYLTCLVSTVIPHTYSSLDWILFYVLTLPLSFCLLPAHISYSFL